MASELIGVIQAHFTLANSMLSHLQLLLISRGLANHIPCCDYRGLTTTYVANRVQGDVRTNL